AHRPAARRAALDRDACARQETSNLSRVFAARNSTRRPHENSSRSPSIPSPKITPPSSISDVIASARPSATIDSVIEVPEATLGEASRTKNVSSPEVGAGSGSRLERSWWIERAQPVAPVPVAVITPDDE